MKEKQKKILNIVFVVLQIVIVLLGITVSAILIANPNPDTARVSGGPVKLLPVLTESMEGPDGSGFRAGDLVVAGRPRENLEIGDIITYRTRIAGQEVLVTHRIVDITRNSYGTVVWYTTRGDNSARPSGQNVLVADVLAVYRFHLRGVGSAISWLQQPVAFALVIILPLAILMIYNVILLIRMIMHSRLEKLAAEAGSQTVQVDEEEIKRKAIEEYLAKQKEENKDN